MKGLTSVAILHNVKSHSKENISYSQLMINVKEVNVVDVFAIFSILSSSLRRKNKVT